MTTADVAYAGYLVPGLFFLFVGVWMLFVGRFPTEIVVFAYLDIVGVPVVFVVLGTLVLSLWNWKHWPLPALAGVTLLMFVLALQDALPARPAGVAVYSGYGLVLLLFVVKWFKTDRLDSDG